MQRAIGGEDARFDVIIHPAATALVIAHRSARLSRLEPRAEDVVRGSECTSRCVSPRFERLHRQQCCRSWLRALGSAPPSAAATSFANQSIALCRACRPMARPTHVLLSFAGGSSARVRLLWDEAPKTIAALLELCDPVRKSFDVQAVHARHSGAEAIFITPSVISSVGDENLAQAPRCGDVLFGFEPKGICEQRACHAFSLTHTRTHTHTRTRTTYILYTRTYAHAGARARARARIYAHAHTDSLTQPLMALTL